MIILSIGSVTTSIINSSTSCDILSLLFTTFAILQFSYGFEAENNNWSKPLCFDCNTINLKDIKTIIFFIVCVITTAISIVAQHKISNLIIEGEIKKIMISCIPLVCFIVLSFLCVLYASKENLSIFSTVLLCFFIIISIIMLLIKIGYLISNTLDSSLNTIIKIASCLVMAALIGAIICALSGVIPLPLSTFLKVFLGMVGAVLLVGFLAACLKDGIQMLKNLLGGLYDFIANILSMLFGPLLKAISGRGSSSDGGSL